MRVLVIRLAPAVALSVLLVACASSESDAEPVDSVTPTTEISASTEPTASTGPTDDTPSADDDIDDLWATNCAGLSDDGFPTVPCDEPHASEFAGWAPSPFEVLPDDRDEAVDAITAVCRPVVEAFLGRPVNVPGAGVGLYVDAELGGPVTGDIECYVNTGGSDILVGLIADIGWEAALNGVVVISTLEPGSCFELDDEALAFGAPVDCGATGALMHLGTFDLDEGPYLGSDAIREIRAQRCAEILTESGLAADPTTVSGTFPAEDDWNRLDQRLVTCDASPL